MGGGFSSVGEKGNKKRFYVETGMKETTWKTQT
jgi:hypothetical protein